MPTQKTDPRLDRPSETVVSTAMQAAPWTTADRRGALNLDRDGSQHRKYHSLYEDLLN